MDTKALRQKILDLAIHGKLVPQDPNDEPASVLLERIRTEKEHLIKEGKIKKSKKPAKASDMPHYENVPFEMPSSWVWTTIGNLCSKIGSGSTPKGSNYSSEGVLFFRSQNVHNDGILLDDIKYISDEVHQSMIGTEVLPNDLLLNITGGSLGRCAIVPNEIDKGNVSQHVCILRPIIISSNYFHALILSTFFSKSMKITGSGREGLPKYNLEQMMFPLPPLAEQHRIVAEIEKWFALIDQIEQGKASLQTTIKQTKSKILDLAIHGRLVPQDPNDEPAAELLKRINPKAEIISQNTDFQSETYPDSWVLTTIESINSYKSHSVNPMITPEEEFDLYSVPIFPTQMPEHNKGKEIGSTKQLIQHGDILLCKINPHLNRVWEVSQQDNDTPKIASSEWIVIRSPHVCSSYLRYFFESESFRQLLCSQVSGVGGSLTRAQPAVVKKNYVPLPPLPEQHRIAAKIEELFSALDNIQKALEA